MRKDYISQSGVIANTTTKKGDAVLSNKPGEKADRSGQYGIVGPRGGQTNQERTVVKGEPFPPTPKPNQRYVMNDPTNNNAGKGK